jgi:phosphoribosyl-ATP pyrophosphohydrolase/phosphoribosyl-AMP cyclohydrolase
MQKFPIQNLDFTKGDGLLPVIVQDAQTRAVLMLGYMNRAAVEKTLAEQRITFFSRSKNRLWTKGETSGNFLELIDLQMDCDQDTLLALVKPAGPVCHQGTDTCFGTKNEGEFVPYLERVIQQRRDQPSDSSYTSSLFQKGINKVAQKVGEEAVELVIEAKDDDKDLFLNEAADLLYHYLVLLVAKEYTWEEVMEVLRGRHG